MKQKGPFRSLAFLGGLLALAAVCASSAADPGGSPQNSNFADTSTWVRCVLGSGVQLTPAGNGFEADYAADAQPDAKGDISAGYFSTFALRGDFTLDIDYTLTTWPASSGVRLGLVLWPSICMIRQGQGPSTQEWHTFGGGPYANIPTDDRQGTLRLVRKGGELLGYYLTGGTWVLVGSRTGDPVFANDFQVFVHSWTASSDFGQRAVGIRLSNFVMKADTVLPGPFGAPSWTTTPPPVPATPAGHWTTGPTMEQSFEARVPSTLYSLLAPRAANTMEQSVEARVPSAPAVQPLESAAVPTGILEEDLNLDLNAAIQSYQSLVSQFDAQRPLAANAIFRMAECYRRLGRMEEARSQYARILREFADQAPLLRLSRKYAANPTTIMPPPNLLPAPHLPAQGSVTGTWKAEEVAFAPWTFTLKAEGAKVTGTVSQGGSSGAMITTLTGATAIYDGAIEGNKVSFKCDSPDGGRTVSFSGVVAGDIITFTRQVKVQPGRFPGMNGIYGASGATHFTAKRVGTSAAKTAPEPAVVFSPDVHLLWDQGARVLSAPGSAFGLSPGPRLLPGLVGWWAGEGNALDSTGVNNGVLQGDVTFVPGEVGLAFSLDGTTADVEVPASPSLDVGLGAGFTVEAWIMPSDLSQGRPIVEWNTGDTNNFYAYNAHFWMSLPLPAGTGAGCLFANLVDSFGNNHPFSSAANLLTSNSFQHIALTYDKSSGNAAMYLNGSPVAQQYLGSFTPQTSSDLYLGCRPAGSGSVMRFAGKMDEVTLYNRGLSAAEIRAAYAAGSLGEHGLPATVALQPTLVNINFAATNPIEVGFAATGLSANDYWNGFTKPYQAFAGLGNLKAADGTPTAIGMTVRNGAGNWYFNYPGVDVMYGTYCYAQDLGDVTVTVTNLPGGQYDFYLYGHGGADNANTLFELRVGENGYGLRSTATNSDWSLTHWAEPAPGRRGLQQDAPGKNVTHWVEGAQYVVYRRVAVAGGGAPVTIIAHPGLSGYTHINGMQIARSAAPAMAAMSLPTYQFLPGPHPTEGTTAPEWQQEQAPSSDCANNLKQIGISFKTWALDHNDQFPFNVSTNSGGTLELCARRADGYDRNAALHFMVMSNELSTPRILICPNDSSKGRSPASDFRNLQPANVTYLLRTGPGVNETNPEAVLVVCPLCKNVLLVDASVQRRPGIQTGPPLPAEGTSP